MSCYQCPDNWFVAHLGRCRGCLYKSAVLSLLLWCGWVGWASRSLEMLSLLILAVAATALLLAHLAVIGWRREWPP